MTTPGPHPRRDDARDERDELAVVRHLREPEPGPPAERPRVRTFRRSDVYGDPVVDGRLVDDSGWLRSLAWFRGLLISRAERDEAALERRLRRVQRTVTRCNVIAVVSPKGGVGKTTCAFVLGNLLASHVRLRTVVVDANPDHGTLGLLAPDGMRSEYTLADAIGDLDQISSAAELHRYVSVLPSGLHLMGAPADPRVMKQMTPDLYGQLTAFLGRFYEVVVLDLGTGLTDPLADFAISRADQSVVVTTPEWVTASIVLDALRYLGGERGNDHITVVLNKALDRRNGGDRQRIEAEFRRQQIRRRVTVPEDARLKTMLDSGTYTLESLSRPCRVPIKELGMAVAGQLV